MNPSRSGRIIASGIVLLVLVGVSVVVAVDLRLPQLSNQDPVEGFGFMVAFVACALTGAVILLRQPRHAIGWILAAVGLIPLVAVPLERWGTYVMMTAGAPDLSTQVGFWLNTWYWYLLIALILIYLPLLFPTGRLLSRRWVVPTLVPSLAVGAMVVAGMLQPTMGSQEQRSIVIDNPLGVAGMPYPEKGVFGGIAGGALAFGVALAVLAFVLRFRRSTGVERQQLKWFFVPVLLLPLDSVAIALELPQWVSSISMPLTVAAFPVAIGVAVTRYRLYDLGRLVSRTVTYATVVGVLVGLYAGTVLLLGAISRQALGEQNDLVVAVSTLVVAGAFQPVRRRVQTVVDRRFNRSRYDAARTVEEFGAHLRDELELSSLAAELRTVTSRTLHPASVGLWVRGARS